MLYAYSVLWCAGTETVAFGPIVTFRAEIADDSPRNDRIELVPQDDGAVKHLLEMEVPRIALQATDGTTVDLCGPGLSVVYAYPRTSPPGGNALDGWDAISGARGCTTQSCAFCDHFAELKAQARAIYSASQPRPRNINARLRNGFTFRSHFFPIIRSVWHRHVAYRCSKQAV